MRLRHIEVFNAIILTGSVTAAARMVNVSQPAISRTLKLAELQLGFPLFVRKGGSLRPTAEAQALYPLVEKLFKQLDEVQQLASNLRAGRGQELRVLTTLALSYDVMPTAVSLFRQKHPEVLLHHKASHSPRIVDALVLQEADVGFVMTSPDHPALQREQVGQGRVVCVAPKGMLTAQELARGSLGLEDIADRPVIGLDARDPLGITLGKLLEDAELTPQFVITVQTYHAALAMAQHGIGIALIESCSAIAADPSRVDVLPVSPDIPTSVQSLRPIGNPKARIAEVFITCFRKALA